MPTFEDTPPDKIAVIGSGSFGTAAAITIARNAAKYDFAESEVKVFVHDEDIVVGDGVITYPHTAKLSRIMNDKKVNVKYLPNIDLPDNITAVPSMLAACVDATLVIFVMPFQFLKPVLPTIKKVISKEPHARGVSLIKEVHFDKETLKVNLVSTQIENGISHSHMPHNFQCGVLMGANVASEIASGDFSESTLASRFRTIGGDDLNEKTRLLLNNSNSFRVYHISDVEGCEACGALKNVIALGAGFVDGLGMGGNTKAALMRIGIQEMERFCNDFLSNVDRNTFQESCGMADLITTCIGGRNRKCGEAFAKHTIDGKPKSWDAIESELLNGQRLRGVKTSKQVFDLLQSQDLGSKYPLFTTIYQICYEGAPVDSIIDGLYIPNGMKGGNRIGEEDGADDNDGHDGKEDEKSA
ncbi:hypothetical protein TrRE_jg11597 [Triparma retinervis]|uniref:Glycerol-3-phosphate dehydrogenase [NAD(+)] n=1 Tax=Triparma retinervis TaxID=2557542 RepID=A0A9W7CG21_9STRA|nr:hypothetical protein TrRE_jg11597 [Triparma retinervis]